MPEDHGIKVQVESEYWEERSEPEKGRFAFAYRVHIRNDGDAPAQLISRHWIITDGSGHIDEVKGLGVVGHQPRLGPGQHFEYKSWCLLRTPHGTMHGTYRMVRDDGEGFEAAIEPFVMARPHSLN